MVANAFTRESNYWNNFMLKILKRKVLLLLVCYSLGIKNEKDRNYPAKTIFFKNCPLHLYF